MKRLIPATIGLLALAVIAVPTAFMTGFATSPPVPKVTGSVALSGPPQYASFNAFQQTPVKGSITYTNFGYYPVLGTGVWTVAPWTSLTVHFGGDYAHTVNVTSIVPTSTNSVDFSGNGSYPGYTWTITGSVNGSNIAFQIVYLTGLPGYTFNAVGTIAPDGSMSGTATDTLSRYLTWSTPPASAQEVFSYTAAVTCASVNNAVTPGTATFGFTIPVGVPLAGTNVVVYVTDGGSPGPGNDTWAHGVDSGPGACTTADASTPYPIISGNLVVH